MLASLMAAAPSLVAMKQPRLRMPISAKSAVPNGIPLFPCAHYALMALNILFNYPVAISFMAIA